MSSFKVGDVVILKSGSPKMTVVEMFTNQLTATWFIKNEQQYGKFPHEALEIYEDPYLDVGTL